MDDNHRCSLHAEKEKCYLLLRFCSQDIEKEHHLPGALKETVGLCVVSKQVGVTLFREQTVSAGYLKEK